jgi:hypothetical protein
MKLSKLIAVKEDGTIPIIKIFKKAFSIAKIKRTNDLHIFYNGEGERSKVTVIYGKNSLIVYEDWQIIAKGKLFCKRKAKKELKKYLQS